ncbi:hypothetical protein FOG50_03421 [Hanseniaspora uvarum]|nr:hypothetical protein FOG50_03421 [Hanseniaspora uvarum]
MNLLTKKFKELIYSINTDDHYSEYDEDEVVMNNKFKLKEFNLTKRNNTTEGSLENITNKTDNSISTISNAKKTNATGTDELSFSDDELNFHHNPNIFYANHDLEYSGDNINLSHLNDNKYRNSSNDLEDDDIDNEGNMIYTHSNSSQVPYEDAIDDGSKDVIAAWEYIKNWCMENSNDLYASLNDPCSFQDLNDVEKDLNVSLPKPFKVSSRIHDGQELDGLSGVQGLFYGLTLMTLDEIVSMRDHWAKIYQNVYSSQQQMKRLPRQGSIPPAFIKLQYCNPKWIPVVTDNAGNHIAIDLDPGMKGTVGQVIIFGRDFDTKFVIAENWGDFMTSFVNDLKSGNWDLDEDSDNDYLKGDGELIFIDYAAGSRVYEDYLNVLKRRTWSVWKKQRDVEILQKNKPKFSTKPQNTQIRQPLYAPKNSSKLNSEVERRVGSVRDFSVSVNHESNPKLAPSVQSSTESLNKLNEDIIKENEVKEETLVQDEVKEEPLVEAEVKEEPLVDAEVKEEPLVQTDPKVNEIEEKDKVVEEITEELIILKEIKDPSPKEVEEANEQIKDIGIKTETVNVQQKDQEVVDIEENDKEEMEEIPL